MSRGIVCIFAKAPTAGRVKTRLAERVGAHRATVLSRAFLVDTWRSANRLDSSVVLALDGSEPLPHLDPEPEIWKQGDGDLGARLERSLRRALERAPWAIALGTDSPGLPRDCIEAAIERLEAGADAVIGPSDDGGFYLLGLGRCPEGCLEGIAWSAETTRERTVSRLEALGMSVAQVAPWYDVDRPEDLDRLRTDLDDARIEAPRTARALAGSEVSVVIPVLDEEKRLARRLEELDHTRGIDDVVVVDGGSRDRTVAIAREHTGTLVVRSRRGRARQMNAGAREAVGDTLLFLHADVALPSDVASWVHRTLDDPEAVGGAFRTWTVFDESNPTDRRAPWLHLADFRSRYSKVPYGDQAIFCRADVFDRIGGYPELPLMEDIELSRRLRREGRLTTVPASVRVSGRRFLRHPLRDTFLVNVFPLLYRMGVPARTLAGWYENIR